jgi:hypothetical protein
MNIPARDSIIRFLERIDNMFFRIATVAMVAISIATILADVKPLIEDVMVEDPVVVTPGVAEMVARIVELRAAPGAGGDEVSLSCESYLGDVADLLSRWQAVAEIASDASRASLDNHVASFQDLRNEARQLSEPSCLQQYDFRNRLVQLLDTGTQVFIQFIAGDEKYTVDAYDFARTDHFIAQELFLDALDAIENTSALPRRVHYLAYGSTGFRLKYMEGFAGWLDAGTDCASGICKIGIDEQPVVLTSIMLRGQRAAVTLYNATDPEAEIHCSILVNGVATMSESGTGEIACDYLEYGR